MIKIGILGDIGAGKSYVAQNFGYPVFNADYEVAKLYQQNKNVFNNIIVIDWGEVPDFDMIINATSLGLKEDDEIPLDFSLINKDKFFYDVIYNPKETGFLKIGKKTGNITINGKLMFVYQAYMAFNIWHGVKPDINDEVLNLLD